MNEGVTMKKIEQVKYLTTDNFERYRTLMRFFYKRHRQMQGTLYRQELYQMMLNNFSSSYQLHELDQDLESLVSYGNILRQQEMIRPKSIEDYRNKHFRYQISEEGILVEEMVYQLTNLRPGAQGELNKQGFAKLKQELEEFLSASHQEKLEIWLLLRREFQQIQQDTANYIGYITSPEVDSKMKTEQFLVYKDKFINYLREFISSVQYLYYSLVDLILKVSEQDHEVLVDLLWQKELEKPTFEEVKREEIAEQFYGEIRALVQWFVAEGDRQSEYQSLMSQTEQMITKITGLIYYFGQELQQYRSRKMDYLQIARWFHEAESLNEVKKQYAAIFGMEHTRHFFVAQPSEATSTKENSWELEPAKLVVEKRGRGSRKERKASSFRSNSAEQKEQIAVYLAKEKERKEKIMSYFSGDLLDFQQIEELDSQSRRMFLQWISKAVATKSSSVDTGLDFKVEIELDFMHRIQVTCEDGLLEMPAVVMRRRREE